MSTAYQVKRPEPLPVNYIRVSLREILDGLSETAAECEPRYECSRKRDEEYDEPVQGCDRCDEDYLKSLNAEITGRETASGKRITIGHMKAVFVKVNMACHVMSSSHKIAPDLWKMMDGYSESLRTLNKTIDEEHIDRRILDPSDFGNILLIEHVELETQLCGYGIGLLAVDALIDQVSGASEGWTAYGTIVLDASGLDSDLESGRSRREVQEKPMQHWQLFGLKLLVPESKSTKRCTFVGDCLEYYGRPDITKVVPHLITPSTLCDAESVHSTKRKRGPGPEDLNALRGFSSAGEYARKRGRGLEEHEFLGCPSAPRRARVI